MPTTKLVFSGGEVSNGSLYIYFIKGLLIITKAQQDHGKEKLQKSTNWKFKFSTYGPIKHFTTKADGLQGDLLRSAQV